MKRVASFRRGQTLGRVIAAVRIARELTQQQAADRAGISVSYWSLLERDKRDPKMKTLEMICYALDIPLFTVVAMMELHRIDEDIARDLSWMYIEELKRNPFAAHRAAESEGQS